MKQQDERIAVYEAVVLVSGCRARDYADATGIAFATVVAELASLERAELVRQEGGLWYHGKKLKDETPNQQPVVRLRNNANGGRVVRKGLGVY